MGRVMSPFWRNFWHTVAVTTLATVFSVGITMVIIAIITTLARRIHLWLPFLSS